MLCGTPVVMTDIPGGRVAVTKTGMGKLAKRGDWKSIGETIIDVLDEPAEYTKPREYIAAASILGAAEKQTGPGKFLRRL